MRGKSRTTGDRNWKPNQRQINQMQTKRAVNEKKKKLKAKFNTSRKHLLIGLQNTYKSVWQHKDSCCSSCPYAELLQSSVYQKKVDRDTKATEPTNQPAYAIFHSACQRNANPECEWYAWKKEILHQSNAKASFIIKAYVLHFLSSFNFLFFYFLFLVSLANYEQKMQ